LDSRTCYPRRAFNQELTDDSPDRVLDSVLALFPSLLLMVGREADMDVEWRIDCAPKRREEERSREESLETTRKPDICL
jgi:hypothetical protein